MACDYQQPLQWCDKLYLSHSGEQSKLVLSIS